MSKEEKLFRKAQICGIIGGLIGIIPGGFLVLNGFAGLIFGPRDSLSSGFAFAFSVAGLILLAIGVTGFMGGVLAPEKPALAYWLQQSVAILLSVGILIVLVGGEIAALLWLFWPSLFWVGSISLLDHCETKS